MIPAPDLLVVGGLTVDRLANGSTVAGGSVLHAARAAAASGRQVATITAAGPEPDVAAAIDELAALGPSLVHRADTSIGYAIRESPGGRRLTLLEPGSPVPLTSGPLHALRPRAVLLAPVAGELLPPDVVTGRMAPVAVAALQGWRRRLVPGKEARPRGMRALGAELAPALAELDALVASEEDLAAVAGTPEGQLNALRRHLGAGPLLVVTIGARGAWLDDASAGRRRVPTRRRLAQISTIGAGDAFAALLTLELLARHDPIAAGARAVAATAALLAARRV